MEWISVKDRLPEDDTLCISYCGRRGCHIVRYDKNGRSNHWVPISGCCFTSVLWSLQSITHWIAIPKSPKDE